jgi:hypothetical protein
MKNYLRTAIHGMNISSGVVFCTSGELFVLDYLKRIYTDHQKPVTLFDVGAKCWKLF